jgi:Glycogen recognition site of AMP-activated protein kinase
MNNNAEIIHRYFDGDMTAAEKEAFMRRLSSEPGLKKEFDALSKALRMVAESPRPAVPLSFTEDVMKRLPPVAVPLGERIRTFLFAGRTLQWNMATALATALILIVSLLVVSRQYGPPMGPVAALHQTAQEPAVTVRLNLYAPQARKVAVSGDFNKWQVDADVMSRQDGGVWTIDIKLKPGVYTYMFVVDGKAWVTDPDAETYQDDGFGNKNAVMRVRT